ncbi:Rhodanese-related sulfurtransferase [Natronincola peptidivorans]|uniref:Rhodanese-related sulfurtransferase n=1 Tax=Natronincola peptidivorans TaxID=426128 RepID=A0A1I0G398_9FIRM|nr:rhodanese-like domain-containing protein [Natronincola peptidivorans]SET64483.1 Rhodanese-related sulfurtransferase [Natronincola peptidivorans]
MNKWIITVLIFVIAFVLYNNKKEEGYQVIKPADAKTMLEQSKDVILLDVRTKEEHQEKHIGGSLLIPLSSLEKEAEKKLPNKEQTIIVYCRSGNRSKTAVNLLLSLGYKNVYDLGGINSWPYEIK